MGNDVYVFKIHTGIVRFPALTFVDVRGQTRADIVGSSYGPTEIVGIP